jgi:hypothetical protein
MKTIAWIVLAGTILINIIVQLILYLVLGRKLKQKEALTINIIKWLSFIGAIDMLFFVASLVILIMYQAKGIM